MYLVVYVFYCLCIYLGLFFRSSIFIQCNTSVIYLCFRSLTFYEGRSINKLQNGVILFIFKMWKFENIRFVGDFILSISCEFYYDDVTVTSFINIRYVSVAVESIP